MIRHCDREDKVAYIDMLESMNANTIEMLAFCVDKNHLDMTGYYIDQLQRTTDEQADMVRSLHWEKSQ